MDILFLSKISIQYLSTLIMTKSLKEMALKDIGLSICEKVGHIQVLQWNTMTNESTLHCSRCLTEWERSY